MENREEYVKFDKNDPRFVGFTEKSDMVALRIDSPVGGGIDTKVKGLMGAFVTSETKDSCTTIVVGSVSKNDYANMVVGVVRTALEKLFKGSDGMDLMLAINKVYKEVTLKDFVKKLKEDMGE